MTTVSGRSVPAQLNMTQNGVMLNSRRIRGKVVDDAHPGHVNRCLPALSGQRQKGITVGLGTRRRMRTAAIVAVLLTSTAACTQSNGVKTQPITPAPTASNPTPTATIDHRAQPAVNAYEAFGVSANNAQRHPIGQDQKWPAGADFTKTSFDPLRAQFMGYIWSLKAQGVEYRGTPDTSHIAVKAIRLEAKPWPTIMLTDCQTGGDWDEYVIKTGKRVPSENGKVPPPYLITVKMIYYKDHWGAQSQTSGTPWL